MISLALRCRLTEKSVINKQQFLPALVNASLQKLTNTNPFYSNITIDNEWKDFGEQLDLLLWKHVTDKSAREPNNSDQTDSDDDVEGNDKFKEKEFFKSSPPFPTVMYNVLCIMYNGSNTSPSEITNIAPGEGQIPVSFILEPNWDARAFPRDYCTGRTHFNEEREIQITPSKYVHARLKCCDDRFAANPECIFHALDWSARNTVASSIQFVERKQFQSEINKGQLVNHENVTKMISDDQIFSSFKNIRGALQFLHNMLLDVLAKIRQFGVYAFFLTCSAAEFHWTEIVQIVAHQY